MKEKTTNNKGGNKMPKTTITYKKVYRIEEEIVEWAKLLSTCRPDSTRFEMRVNSIARLIQVRKGLLRVLNETRNWI